MTEEKKKIETLTPVMMSPDGDGVAVHRDGDHTCVVPFVPVPEGMAMNGCNVFAPGEDGSYERIEMGQGPTHGPAQVATKEYRESWERTFGKINSTGGAS
jgi:hypothetical protein